MNTNEMISFDLDPVLAKTLKSASQNQSLKLKIESLSEEQLGTCSGGKAFLACNSAFTSVSGVKAFLACNSAFKSV